MHVQTVYHVPSALLALQSFLLSGKGYIVTHSNFNASWHFHDLQLLQVNVWQGPWIMRDCNNCIFMGTWPRIGELQNLQMFIFQLSLQIFVRSPNQNSRGHPHKMDFTYFFIFTAPHKTGNPSMTVFLGIFLWSTSRPYSSSHIKNKLKNLYKWCGFEFWTTLTICGRLELGFWFMPSPSLISLKLLFSVHTMTQCRQQLVALSFAYNKDLTAQISLNFTF